MKSKCMKCMVCSNPDHWIQQKILPILDKVDSEHPGAPEKPQLSTTVEDALLLLLNCIRSQRLGDIAYYLVRHSKPIFATLTAPMGSKTGVVGSILACPDSVPAGKMQV